MAWGSLGLSEGCVHGCLPVGGMDPAGTGGAGLDDKQRLRLGPGTPEQLGARLPASSHSLGAVSCWHPGSLRSRSPQVRVYNNVLQQCVRQYAPGAALLDSFALTDNMTTYDGLVRP